jgi:glycosyltransferase involved in cell wall biosynthesis
MHQYAADAANHMTRAGHDVHLVTTTRLPRDRYHPNITIHTSVRTTGTGLSIESLRLCDLKNAQRVTCDLQPNVVHFTGPHLWNVPFLRALRRAGIPTVHTLHDLDPHSGTVYGRLLYIWNRMVLRLADHVLVHGACYRQRLLSMGLPPERVTMTPLVHLFLGFDNVDVARDLARDVVYEPWALFFGRLARYKGVDRLLAACARGDGFKGDGSRLVLAGPGSLAALWMEPLPSHVQVRSRLIGDEESLDLFRSCGLLVLPYVDATQSALIAAAYFFHKPVVVTRAGALPEYVQEGHTGWLVEPGDVAGLRACLAEALSDPARLARMGAAGRAQYDAWWHLERETLLSLYERVAQTRRGEKGWPPTSIR